MFSTNVYLSANNNKKKGRAIKCFLFGLKSWWKEVGSVLAYCQKWPISSDETFYLNEWNVFFRPSLQSLHSVTTYTPNCDCSIDAAETLLLTMKRGKKLDYNHFDWKSKFAFDIDLYQYSRCHIMISRNMKLICKVVISCHNKIRDPSKIQGDPRDCVL